MLGLIDSAFRVPALGMLFAGILCVLMSFERQAYGRRKVFVPEYMICGLILMLIGGEILILVQRFPEAAIIKAPPTLSPTETRIDEDRRADAQGDSAEPR